MFHNDVIRCLRYLYRQRKIDNIHNTDVIDLINNPALVKNKPASTFYDSLIDIWSSINDNGKERENMERILKPLNLKELRRLKQEGMCIGAHTARHIILGREKWNIRFSEIHESINFVKQKLGICNVPFSYPNGLPGDFDDRNISLLKELSVPFALVGYPGPNYQYTDVYKLKRTGASLFQSPEGLLFDLLGFRDRAFKEA